MKSVIIELIESYNALEEEKLDSEDRKQLSTKTFGLPEERKYPLNDEGHVKSAIAYFHNCPNDRKPKLAKAILRAAKKYNMDIDTDTTVYKYANK